MIYVKLYQLLRSHKPSTETLILNYGERSLALSSWRWEQQHFYTFLTFQSVLSNVSLFSSSQSKLTKISQIFLSIIVLSKWGNSLVGEYFFSSSELREQHVTDINWQQKKFRVETRI